MGLFLYLLVDFVKHRWVVVFFRVVVETDHAILLINAGVDLAIFNLHARKTSLRKPPDISALKLLTNTTVGNRQWDYVIFFYIVLVTVTFLYEQVWYLFVTTGHNSIQYTP